MFVFIGPRMDVSGTVNFRVERDGDKRVWRVSHEALQDHFGALALGNEAAFDAGQSSILEAANEKFAAGVLEPEGHVLVKTADL